MDDQLQSAIAATFEAGEILPLVEEDLFPAEPSVVKPIKSPQRALGTGKSAKSKQAARERMLAHAEEYLTGTPEEIRWRKHRRAKEQLVRHGEGRWSALEPSKHSQAEQEFQAVLERWASEGRSPSPVQLSQIRGGIITAIKLYGGRAHFPLGVRKHNRRIKTYSGMVLKKIAMGQLSAPKGMR